MNISKAIALVLLTVFILLSLNACSSSAPTPTPRVSMTPKPTSRPTATPLPLPIDPYIPNPRPVQTCTMCHGSGLVLDRFCNGTGISYYKSVSPPKYSGNDGYTKPMEIPVYCTICGGTGYRKCESCGGTGSIR